MEKLDRTQADQDKEIASLAKEVSDCFRQLHLKLEKDDGTKIWNHF